MAQNTFLTAPIKMILAFTVIILTGLLLVAAGNPFEKFFPHPTLVPTFTPGLLNKIEISPDRKSIINAETKETILVIDAVKKYLMESGYEYNPDTFQNINARYSGDCFNSAALSNQKNKLVFSVSCLAGDLPQPWIGVYNILKCPKGAQCDIVASEQVKFLIGGSGDKFVWSENDKNITYEANLGLSGLIETRTIDSEMGKILKNN